MVNNFIIFIFLSYLIGSIPFAYILTYFLGYGDIRKIGSGNVGATNVLRTGKKSLAVAVLFLDISKGFAPIAFISFYYEGLFDMDQIIFIGSFSIIGHIFPIWLKFKGGKGVATYIGFILGINYGLFLFFISLWLIIAIIKKYSSLASILSLLIIPIGSYFLSYNLNTVMILILLGIIIIIKHHSNIKRLISKSENKIKL
jgi:glycerol-3-phosphate acyltransferase PlsY